MRVKPMSGKVLIIEDESDIRELMSLHLKRQGYEVSSCGEGEEAQKRILSESFDLLLVDWMLPRLSGPKLIEWLRADGKTTPVLMVTAKSEPTDIVAGLEAGADDYITKPFELDVFLARVKALMRRAQSLKLKKADESANHSKLIFSDLEIDLSAYRVIRGKTELSLTPSEFKLLVALAQNQGKVLTREQLIDLVQGEDVIVVDRAVDTHVFGLRKKMGKSGDWIETVRGVGYRLKGNEI